MLVLKRKFQEKITIGRDKKVILTILEIKGDRVTIGFEAEKETPIFRNELIDSQNPVCEKKSQIPKETR